MHLLAAPLTGAASGTGLLWMRLAPARRWLAAHHDHVAGLFAAHGWRVARGAPGDPCEARPGEAVAVMSDPWVEPLPELAAALAAAGGGGMRWVVPRVAGLDGAQGWSARRGPYTLEDYRRTFPDLRRGAETPSGIELWTGFAVAPAAAAATLLAAGWPPREGSVELAADLALFRYADPSDHPRTELDPHLPDADGLWVDIGCGTGRVGERLRRPGRRVVGVEPDPELARTAAGRLDQVIPLPVEAALAGLGEPIRCALLADVLEHTTDPAAVLRQVRAALAPDGHAVVSFPNAAWAPLVRSLAAGRWDVTLAGNQARDHFALFTPASFANLAGECGFRVERLAPLASDAEALPWRLRLWAKLAAWSAGGDARALASAQWVAVLRPSGVAASSGD